MGAVGRADHSAGTLLMTRFMKATAPDVYTCDVTDTYSTSACSTGLTLKTTPEDAAAAVWQHTDADLTQTGLHRLDGLEHGRVLRSAGRATSRTQAEPTST